VPEKGINWYKLKVGPSDRSNELPEALLLKSWRVFTSLRPISGGCGIEFFSTGLNCAIKSAQFIGIYNGALVLLLI
jgi:hypothetical protein